MEEASSFLRKENRLKVFNGYVSDADEARLLAATDWMWVGYREFYMMSGVLVLAARHGIPCLVSDSGVAGYLVKKHQCGLAVNADDRAEVLGALQEISRDTGMLKDKGARAMAAFIRSSIAEFQRVISTVVEIASSVGTEGLS
jgi:glycosyltransferase involved in cell wall biosynthesis